MNMTCHLVFLATLACACGGATPRSFNDHDWRRASPTTSTRAEFVPPVVRLDHLTNGAVFVHVTGGGSALVCIRVVTGRGTGDDPLLRPGLVALSTRLRIWRTSKLSHAQLAARLDEMGATLHDEVTTDASAISLTVPERYTAEALDLVADLIEPAAFLDEDLDGARASLSSESASQLQESQSVASLELDRVLFGADHPYAIAPERIIASLAAIDANEVSRFPLWDINDLAVTIASGAAHDELVALVSRTIGGVASTPERSAETASHGDDIKWPDAPVVHVVDRAGTQASLALAIPAVDTSEEGWAPQEVLNRALGGMYASRLNLLLREVRGYTYYVRTRVEIRDSGSFIRLAGNINLDHAGDALADISKEVVRFVSEPPTDEELKRARAVAESLIWQRFQWRTDAAAAIDAVALGRETATEFFERFARIARVDSPSLADAARRSLGSRGFVAVFVGPKDVIVPQLERVGFIVHLVRGP